MTIESYQKSFEVKWADIDVNGHLRNTAYSEFATHVRMCFLRDFGFPNEKFQELQIGPILTKEEISFRREVPMNDVLTVNMKILSLSKEGSLFRLKHEFYRENNQLAAFMIIEGAWLDRKLRKPTIPQVEICNAFREIPKDSKYDGSYFDAEQMMKRIREST